MYEFTQESFPGITYQGVKDLHKENIHTAIKNTKLKKKEETEEEFKKRSEIYTSKKSKTPLYHGMKEILFKLSKNYFLVINTSAIEANCVPILEFNGIRDCFDLIAAKELHISKVEKFKLIAKKYNKKPSDLIFITDTVGDVLEAHEAEVPTIVVTWGLHQEPDFRDVPRGSIIGFANNPRELLEIISKKQI